MILLWGIYEDDPIRLVEEELVASGAEVFFLDHRQILDTDIELEFRPEPAGFLRCGDRQLDLAAVRAAYFRPYDCRRYPALEARLANRQSLDFQHVLRVEDILWSWAEITPALLLNRPTPMLSNHSKPYQTEVIRQAGLHSPETLLTTSPAAARRFATAFPEPVYKSISGVRSIVSRLFAGTEERLDRLAWCPTQFQEYISGTNYRVHVVDQEIFATCIRSEADDYRYHAASLEACTLPPDIERGCRRLSRMLDLPLCGIDFKRTEGDEWVCFEVNPSPAFSYYQNGTGQPIAQAIAGLLQQGQLSTTKAPALLQ